MDKFLFYAHGSSLNHGCEAIVKTTYNILKKAYGNISVDLSTLDWKNDKDAFDFINNYIKNKDFSNDFISTCFTYFILRVLKNQDLLTDIKYKKFYKRISEYSKDTVLFSVGGDNYCTEEPLWLYKLNEKIDSNNLSRVLWGCSVEPKTTKEKMIHDLEKFKVIHARESITYESLLEKKVNTNIFLRPDPAFTLGVDKSKVPDEMKNTEYIGINLSPVIMSCESKNNIAYQNYYNLVKYILTNTKYNVALIPHVVIPGNSDFDSMKSLYDEFSETGRIIRISNTLSAEQYKGIISECKLFIGARTHATIAAYSTCTPTLVVGYSVKAKGIAKDLFGDYNGYILPVQNLNDEDELIKSFIIAEERVAEDKRHLESIMPEYIKKAWEAGEEVKRYLEALK